MSPISLIAVVGPTASGKSDFAQELALQSQGEIINCDSQQFYRDMDIGTGKVLPQDQKVKHHLMDLCNPGDWMSAGKFSRLADQTIVEITLQQKTPIVVGGTGLYLRALLEGLDPLPQRDEKIRDQLKVEIEEQGLFALYERLKKLDPVSAEKINPNDRSRIIRYLEIYQLSGELPSKQMGANKTLRYEVKIHCLRPDRCDLREKIAQRVEGMLEIGWMQEVEALLARYPAFAHWKAKPIGYQELLEVTQKKLSLEEAKAKIILLTQRYAKRQQTFFRGMLDKPNYAEKNRVIYHDLSSIFS